MSVQGIARRHTELGDLSNDDECFLGVTKVARLMVWRSEEIEEELYETTGGHKMRSIEMVLVQAAPHG